MTQWPINYNTNATQAEFKNNDSGNAQAARDAKYATREELMKYIEELRNQVGELRDLVRSEKVHENSDLNGSSTAQHHSLGLGPNNAAFGNHTHNGSNSNRISLVGTSLAGANASGLSLSGATIQGAIFAITNNIPPEVLLACNSSTGPMRMLNGSTLTGSRATDTWRQSVNNALVRLGATNSSSS